MCFTPSQSFQSELLLSTFVIFGMHDIISMAPIDIEFHFRKICLCVFVFTLSVNRGENEFKGVKDCIDVDSATA